MPTLRRVCRRTVAPSEEERPGPRSPHVFCAERRATATTRRGSGPWAVGTGTAMYCMDAATWARRLLYLLPRTSHEGFQGAKEMKLKPLQAIRYKHWKQTLSSNISDLVQGGYGAKILGRHQFRDKVRAASASALLFASACIAVQEPAGCPANHICNI